MVKKLKIYDYTCKYCKKNDFEIVTVDDGEEVKEIKLVIDHKPCRLNAYEIVVKKINKLVEKLYKCEMERDQLLTTN
jgi:deoxycytidylate deaminase